MNFKLTNGFYLKIGCRPETLSTARGFGKRGNLDTFAQQDYLNNPSSLTSSFERLRFADNQLNKENENDQLLK